MRWEIVPKFSSSGKNEYLCRFILDRGNVYLDLMDGRILPGNGILTK